VPPCGKFFLACRKNIFEREKNIPARSSSGAICRFPTAAVGSRFPLKRVKDLAMWQILRTFASEKV